MTLAELRAQLAALNLPDDTIVILAKDGEGNGHSPLVEAEHAMYLADTTWSGRLHADPTTKSGQPRRTGYALEQQ